MKYSEYLERATQDAFVNVFKYVKAVPADKLDWKPLDEGQSVMSMARELARTPFWAVDIIKAGKFEWTEETSKVEAEIAETLTTVEACEAACAEGLRAFFEYIAAYPEEELNTEFFLPFGEGKNYPVWDLMDFPRWNFSYHQGQIAYIQTLYGDKKMY